MQYLITVPWDSSLVMVEVLPTVYPGSSLNQLAKSAIKTTTGAPATNANKFIAGAVIQNAYDGTQYQNTGSSASPTWTLIDAGLGITLPDSITDSSTTSGTSLAFIMSALTTGIAHIVTASAATTGKLYRAVAVAATLTGAGRYFSAYDGATEVWSIGPNGHNHSTQTTAPTIAVTTANGISAAAITAGSTDVCGVITTTGTNNNGGSTVLDVTFNKTYTAAPKTVNLTPRNASAAKAAATSLAVPYISAISATGFTITIPADASAGATPSFQYQVIA